MRRVNGSYLYSPSDLITFLECDHVSWLDRYDLDRPGELQRDPDAEEDELLRSAGDAHERQHLASLLADGKGVRNLKTNRSSLEATAQAMAAGAEVIYQAYLEHREFAGYADFLIRIPGQSNFGPYKYEILDTKLARSLKPYFAVQLCCYAEMLAAVQGILPSHVGIILGDGKTERLQVSDYWYYYLALKHAFLEQQCLFDPSAPPEIPPRGDFRQWSGYVNGLLEQRDDLSRVAGIRSSQIKRLHDAGIATVRELTANEADRIPRMGPPTFQRLRDQARLQVASEGTDKPAYVALPPDPGQPRTGLAVLPPASSNDVFFDMEGFPLIEGGLEYLFGASHHRGDSSEFTDWWAHDRHQEQEAFEGFVRWAHARWREDPSMHIYHYASYEKTALRKLMGRFGVCETELDDLLRNGVFVDLYAVVRQGLLIGEPSYSLKNVERLYLGKRAGQVATASDSMVYYHRWREQPDGHDWNASATLRLIRDYNREDCDSTLQLAGWLRDVQAAQGLSYLSAGAKEAKELSEATSARAALAAEMIAEAPRIEDPGSRRVHELLAWLLEFHRREQKPEWWALFERLAMNEQDLIEDPDCLGGLEQICKPESIKRSLRYSYRFDPHQETKLREGKTCCFAHDGEVKVDVESIDLENGTLTFTLGAARPRPPERLSLIPYEFVPPKSIVESIERLVSKYRSTGQLPSAISDFLSRRPPRLKGQPDGLVIGPNSSTLNGAIDAALKLDQSTLVVQGPPGSGKTFTAARMIAALVESGRRVGVTSNSHRAISLLLQEASKACRERNTPFTGANVTGQNEDGADMDGFESFPTGKELFEQEV